MQSDDTTASSPATTTDPSSFKNPYSLKNKVGRLLWAVVCPLLFRPTPWFMGGWRNFLLRCFGAKLGKCWLHPSVRVWAPWLLEVGDDTYIDRACNLYNAYGLKIGDRCVISFETLICTAGHDFTLKSFPLVGGKVHIESDCWVAAQVFVGPGVKVGQGAVLAARSLAVKDIPPWTVCGGSPAKAIKPRVIRG